VPGAAVPAARASPSRKALSWIYPGQTVLSDKDGHFVLPNVDYGTNMLRASCLINSSPG
jgi:hypothetical protein